MELINHTRNVYDGNASLLQKMILLIGSSFNSVAASRIVLHFACHLMKMKLFPDECVVQMYFL